MAFTLFGLTGGIACGKSTVARFLQDRGLPVIDADLVARQVVAPESDGLRCIVEAFGDGVLDAQGALDRQEMASIVFNDAEARRTLERITHPRIRQRTRHLAHELEARAHPLAAYEAALLVENGLVDSFRPLVVVAVDPSVQVHRLMRRDRMSEAQARARLASQMPIGEKVAVADHVIDTTGSFAQVRARTEAMLREVCEETNVDAGRYGL